MHYTSQKRNRISLTDPDLEIKTPNQKCSLAGLGEQRENLKEKKWKINISRLCLMNFKEDTSIMSRLYKGVSYDQITEHHIHSENELMTRTSHKNGKTWVEASAFDRTTGSFIQSENNDNSKLRQSW